MTDFKKIFEFYRGKKVLITGHTGFKGSWLSCVLGLCGAEVYGYALKSPTEPSLFDILYGPGASAHSETELKIRLSGPSAAVYGVSESRIADIRDFDRLKEFYDRVNPDIVIHLAAQPIVRESYRVPRETYEINVLGTVNLLECVRLNPCCRSFLNVTTDKVYYNEEIQGYAYREDDKLDGYDPYSNSKSCSELVTHSYAASFLNAGGVAVSTARAGNVIGGGDFSPDRIIPDCVRAFLSGSEAEVRNPYSVRPYQHVLEPLFVYLTIAMEQYSDSGMAGWYNVGPDLSDCLTTGELSDLFIRHMGGKPRKASPEETPGPHEAGLLLLDNQKIKSRFGWEPVWSIDRAVRAVCDWTRSYVESDESANEELLREIADYSNCEA